MERPVPGGLREKEEEQEEEKRVLVSENSWRPCPNARRRVRGCLEWVKRQLFCVGEDWYFLFILGVLMATISFVMDIIVGRLYAAHSWLYREIGDIGVLKYLSWTLYPTALAAFSTGFSQSITPHSGGEPAAPRPPRLPRTPLGNGRPLKFMRTTVTREYEVGVPLSKKFMEGSYFTPQKNAGGSTSRRGVLFSIEVMSPHFAVRDYWRGFFAATCGAFMFRILAVFNSEQGKAGEMGCALFPFTLPCGIFGVLTPKPTPSFFSPSQKPLLLFLRVTSRLIFPSTSWRPSFLSFWAWGALAGVGPSLLHPYSYCTLTSSLFMKVTMEPPNLWVGPPTMEFPMWGIPCSTCFPQFWMLILATTLPLPAGLLQPHSFITVSAAAFAGSVTHAVSTALLVCEATGHLGHVLPIVLTVLVANAISQKHQPSFYDAGIIVKKLPYLPPIRSRHIASYRVTVEEFMERRLVALAKGDGFQEVLVALDASADTEYPVVESTEPRASPGPPRGKGKRGGGHPTAAKKLLFRPKINVTFLQPATVGTLKDDCAIEPIMLQFSPWTSLHQAYHLFQLLKLQRVFVTRSGELVGAVSRAEVREKGKGEGEGKGRKKGGKERERRKGGRGEKEGRKGRERWVRPHPTSSPSFQLRTAIEELANPK
uniref:Chloride channel protein n=1 Tax=Malurus cyaneus samueli TaxID=2593467 RepID=A0A8C5U3W1_9PASS